MNKGSNTYGQRVQLLLNEKWAGNRRLALKVLPISHASLSRVLHDQQSPPVEVVSALVRLTGVDSTWLLTGEGVPFPGRDLLPSDRPSLPEARHLLSELRGPDMDELPRRVLPSATLLAKESRYLFRVDADDPLVADPGLKIAPGDLILLETDQTYWKTHADELVGRLCVLAIKRDDRESRQWARIITDLRSVDDIKTVEAEPLGGKVTCCEFINALPGSGKRSRVVIPLGVEFAPRASVHAISIFVWREL